MISGYLPVGVYSPDGFLISMLRINALLSSRMLFTFSKLFRARKNTTYPTRCDWNQKEKGFAKDISICVTVYFSTC